MAAALDKGDDLALKLSTTFCKSCNNIWILCFSCINMTFSLSSRLFCFFIYIYWSTIPSKVNKFFDSKKRKIDEKSEKSRKPTHFVKNLKKYDNNKKIERLARVPRLLVNRRGVSKLRCERWPAFGRIGCEIDIDRQWRQSQSQEHYPSHKSSPPHFWMRSRRIDSQKSYRNKPNSGDYQNHDQIHKWQPSKRNFRKRKYDELLWEWDAL